MINWTERFVGVLAVVTLICSTAMAADLNVSVTSGGSGAVIAVPCGATLGYEVTAALSDTSNLGLAGFKFDLEFSGGPLDPADTPTADPMLNFAPPAGISALSGFEGAMVGGRLEWMGGAQNTINNTVDNAPFPIGTVITGVAHTETLLMTGSLTTPVEPGTYTLSLSKLAATVIIADDSATGYWVVAPGGVGTINDLTIEVLPADPPATASNDGPACAGTDVTLSGGPDGMAGYSWTGPGGFTSGQQNAVVSPAVEGIYKLSVTDVNNCLDSAATTVTVIPGPCEAWEDCDNNDVYDGCEADTDQDGLIDGCDNCPNHPNPGQQDGDGDGIGDACENDGPQCDPGGPYSAECAGVTTTVQLDGSGSSDPNPGDTLTFAWTTDCPGGSFDDPDSPTPLLTVTSVAPCPLECNVTLTVTDEAGASETCSESVSVLDSTVPDISCPDNTTVECDGAGNTADLDAWLGGVSAGDVCGGVSLVDDFAGLSDECLETGSATVTWTATDNCGLTNACMASSTVEDNTAPVLVLDTTPITVVDTDCSGDEAVTLPTATVADVCDPAPTLSDDAPSTYPAAVDPTIVTFTATDECGNSTGETLDVKVDFGANIFVTAVRHTVGSGSHPGSTKEPLVDIEICAYDKSDGSCARTECGGISHQHYWCIAVGEDTDGDGVIDIGPCQPVNCCTTDANGECTINLPPGDYIIISADATRQVLPDPLGVSASDLLCGEVMQKHLQQIVTAAGRKLPGKTTRRTGSELLITEPEFVVWDDTMQPYPFIFESVGSWCVTTGVAPPDGFVSDSDSLNAAVSNEIQAVQFMITEVGSQLVRTETTFDLFHMGGRRLVESSVGIKLTPEYAVSRGFDVNRLRIRGLIYEEVRWGGPIEPRKSNRPRVHRDPGD